MSEPLYYIVWRAVKTGATGMSEKCFPESEAQRYADEMNRDDAGLLTHHLHPAVWRMKGAALEPHPK